MALLDRLFGKKKDDEGGGEGLPSPPKSSARRFSMASGRVLPDPARAGEAPASALQAALPDHDDPMLADFPLGGDDLGPSVPDPVGAAAANTDTVRHLPGVPAAPLGEPETLPLPPATPPKPSHKVRVSAQNKTLGALLVAGGHVTEEQVDAALEVQEREGGLLGMILTRLGYVHNLDVAQALGRQRTITTVTLKDVPPDPEIKLVFPRSFCVKNRMLVFERFGQSMICVAMANVLDTAAKNQVRERANVMVKPFDAEWGDLQEAIDRWYSASESGDLAIELPGEDERRRRRLESAKKAEEEAKKAEAAAKKSPSAGAAASDPAPDDADAALRALHLQPLPDPVMPVIPVTRSYAAEVVQWNKADPEQRWLATHLVDNILPPIPATDLPYIPEPAEKA